ncbi:site-specific DNA-methyltransferase [Sulfurimonas sp.]|uniref:site-specific DNA-methyltransferase n=1 Tax=Sulfurimonas sp. TaxID=2022749 RepID=UPI001A08993C|nr:site-specific DNA-methyltransferase [Sulfurimonas sp.]MBE0515488.1 site-specific DNA-methyltransferase [Sulfurimonas sp.]
MILKIIQHMQELLKNSERFCDKEGNLFFHNILESVENIDAELIKLLVRDEKAKKQFFTKIEDVYVLDQNKLIEFFTMNEFSKNSYTSYTNKIGLIKKDSFIKKFDDVVLAWPYKDCILEGRQSKDNDKKNEVFYNEILSRDEIDRLFEPKAFTNIKRFTKDGVEENPQMREDDNLIIKGNNLIALHSLKKKFAGKVKLIYIDPPYNTGNDSFNYNDRFNHSTWLTFMKNRLEVAREFLSEDGVIFIQCDDNEQAYLKVLMDEIFGINCFISNSIVIINRGGRDYGGIAKTHEYLLIYSNNALKELNFIDDKEKKFDYEDNQGGFNLMELRNRNILFNDKNRPNLCYPFYVNPNSKDNNSLLEISLEPKEGFVELMPLKSQGVQTVWRWGKEKSLANINGEIKGKEKADGGFMIVQKYRKTTSRQRSVWDEKPFVNERGTEHIKMLFGDKIFAYPKSEFLIERIIEISTQENDIVMDFHLGSGTTAAAAHKMNRRYIGIEQMDYIEDIAVERMKKVIEGEQGGISKALNWQGGGSFIYAELKQIDTFKDAEIGKLNKNMHYLPIAEIEDAEYKISEEEIAINKKFYGIENE